MRLDYPRGLFISKGNDLRFVIVVGGLCAFRLSYYDH